MFDLIAGLLILGGNLFNLKQGCPHSRPLQRYRQGFRTIFKVGIGYGSACVLNAFWPSWHPVTLFLLLLFVCATGYTLWRVVDAWMADRLVVSAAWFLLALSLLFALLGTYAPR